MATISERLQYVMSLDTRQATAAAQQFGKAADSAIEGSTTRLDRMGNRFVAAGAGAVAFAGVAGRALWNLGQGASHLNESVNAINVVFGDAADGVLAIGDNAADSMGLSRRSFNELAVSVSAFAKEIAGGLGRTVPEVMEEMTTRASDFASVMNMDVSRAMQLFRSALAGETESMRQFGIDVSAATVEQYAFEEGLASSRDELTEAVKQQARYGVIMRETEQMAGDFANTSGDLANAQRILSANMENLRDNIGSGVLPMMNELVGAASAVTDKFMKLSPEAQGTIGKFAALGTVGIGLLGTLSMITGQVIKMRDRFHDAGGALNRAGKMAKGLGVMLGVAGAALAVYELAAMGAAKATGKLEDEMRQVAGAADDQAVDKYFRALRYAFEDTEDSLLAMAGAPLDALHSFDEALRHTAEISPEVVGKMLALEEATGELSAGFIRNGFSAEEARSNVATLAEAYEEHIESSARAGLAADAMAEDVANAADSMSDGAGSAEELAGGLDEVTTSATDAMEALLGARQAQQELLSADLALRGAQDRMVDAQREVTGASWEAAAAQEELKKLTDQNITSGEEYDEALRNAIDTQGDYEDSLRDAESAALEVAAAEVERAERHAAARGEEIDAIESQRLFRESLQRMADKAEGPVRDALNGLIAQLEEAEKDRVGNLDIHFRTHGFQDLMNKRAIASDWIRRGPDVATHGGGLVRHGTVEHFDNLRPDEVVSKLQEGEAVLTPEQQKAMANSPGVGGGGGNNYYITVNAGMGADGDDIGRIVVNELKKYERRNGPGSLQT